MKLKQIIATPLLIGTLLNPFLAENAMAKKSFIFDYNLGYESDLVSKVENVSFLNNEQFNVHNKVLFGGKVGTNISFGKRTRLNLGLGIDFNVNDKREDFKSAYEPENCGPILSCEGPYFEHPYASVHRAFFFKKNKYLRMSPYSEIETKLTDRIGLGLGCELYQEKIVFEKGYQWSDGLEEDKRYNLADLMAAKPYASLKIYSTNGDKPLNYSIDFGLTRLIRKRLTELGKGINIKFKKKGYFVGFRVGTNF